MGLIVDSFAGGGGASTGIELALNRYIDIAINHDPAAIAMHTVNHPHTRHYCESVWDVDPVKACGGQPVDLAWFSPDCKHFSKAKGSALVDKGIRGLAWIVLRWAGKVRPKVIILENVEEFITWGPVRKGRPVKDKKGQTFNQWLSQLEALGYKVEHRELVSADYGAPTSRKRFYLIARCDGISIKWPEPTHGNPDSPEVKAGLLKPWKTAADIIDWSLPSYSIFASKQYIKQTYGVNAVRPLADNTLRRVIRGVDKFTIKSGRPFIVQAKFQNEAQDIHKPLTTITAVGAHEVVSPVLSPAIMCNNEHNTGAGANEPLPTITTANRNYVTAASLVQYHTEQTEKVRGQGLREPLQTVDAANRYGLAGAHLSEWYGNAQDGLNIAEPMRTQTAKDREALALAHITKYYGGVVGENTDEPLPTVTAIDHNALTLAHVAEFKGQDKGQAANVPLRTITASIGEFGAVTARAEKYANGVELCYWPEIRALLNKHCGYSLSDDEVLLLHINGADYFISDISLRMLTPRELFNAQGFPPDYIIDVDANGKPYPKTAQVARCGNAVCPPVAMALVRANVGRVSVERTA